jgi:DNA-nicking Smr family endonuclease
MVVSGQGQRVMTVDIHGMASSDAKRQLQQLLTRLPPTTEELLVIHGYNGGTVLMNMVRGELKHPRIQSKILSLNAGQTRILLKPVK